jgi:quinoprotein glucose dehydrogenase
MMRLCTQRLAWGLGTVLTGTVIGNRAALAAAATLLRRAVPVCLSSILILSPPALAADAAPALAADAAPALAADAAPAVQAIDWPAWGRTPGGTHFSPAQQINRDNVGDLELLWEHRSGDVRQGRRGDGDHGGPQTSSSFQATPIVVDGLLYYCSPFNKVFALDAQTGQERWHFDPKVDPNADVLPNCRGVSYWRDPVPKDAGAEAQRCAARVFVGTLDARLIALDAATGERCADFGEQGSVDVTAGLSDHQSFEYSITSPPAILGDLVITGSMVLDNVRVDVPSGVVRAYDVRTGALRWAFNPVPKGQAALNDDGTFRSGTTNVWSVISVDADRELVFVPTGNTSPDYYGGHRDGLDEFSSSVIALNAADGSVAWNFQTVHHDIWDYDVPSQPTLVELPLAGQRVPVVVQLTKMGHTFVLHRDSGEPVWPVQERPVPQDGAVAGEQLSPTQPFPTHVPVLNNAPLSPDDAWGLTPWDRGQCRKSIEALHNLGLFTPPTVEGSVFFPGNSGGNNWGSPAIDPDSGVMVVMTNRVPSYLKLTPRKDCDASGSGAQLGTPYCSQTRWLVSPLGVPCTEPPWATLDAVDLVAGKILWSVPLGTTRNMAPFPFWWIKGVPGIGGPLLTAGGLVFTGGNLDYYFRALDRDTGQELWRTALPTAANAVPMTFQTAGGQQIVVVAAGGHWSGMAPPGDHLRAYALPVP